MTENANQQSEKIANKILTDPSCLTNDLVSQMSHQDIIELLVEAQRENRVILEGLNETPNLSASETIAKKVIQDLTEACHAAQIWLVQNPPQTESLRLSTTTVDADDEL